MNVWYDYNIHQLKYGISIPTIINWYYRLDIHGKGFDLVFLFNSPQKFAFEANSNKLAKSQYDKIIL